MFVKYEFVDNVYQQNWMETSSLICLLQVDMMCDCNEGSIVILAEFFFSL